ncbi:MAG: hypothetical protein WKG07_16040 [Hymenobacter sp.]
MAAKEAEETDYWLQLCQHAPTLPQPTCPVPLTETRLSVRRLLARIIISSKASATRGPTISQFLHCHISHICTSSHSIKWLSFPKTTRKPSSKRY